MLLALSIILPFFSCWPCLPTASITLPLTWPYSLSSSSMENFFGYSIVQLAQSWSQSSPSTAGSTVGKSAVVVRAVIGATSPLTPDWWMLVDDEVGVRKVRARWRADIMVDSALVPLSLACAGDGDMTQQR